MTEVATLHEAAERGVLVLACGALAREILDLIARNDWRHLTLKCLPAILHNRPERIPAAVDAVLARSAPLYRSTFVAYADCGTGGRLAAVCRHHGVEMLDGPHCYAVFQSFDATASDSDADAFYLTDFLVRHFETFVWRPLGLDRHPELRPLYFGNYRALVYLAQTSDPLLTELAERQAARLGLAFERRETGYGALAGALSAL